MFEVLLYNNTSDWEVADKQLTSLGSVQGDLIEGGGILTPTIRIESETPPTFNYCKIEYFGGRYYKVDGEPIWVCNNIWTVKLMHDSLMNLKSQYRQLTGLINRQEFQGNKYLIDGNKAIEVDTNFITRKLNETTTNQSKFDKATYIVVFNSSIAAN